MNYLRHKRGGGKVCGQGFACQESYVSPQSSVRDEAEVYDSYLLASHASGAARVVRSELFYTAASHHARIWGNAHLYNVRVYDFAAIANARIVTHETEPIVIDGLMWIDKGEWYRAPRYALIADEELTVCTGLTECVRGRMHIGCWCKTFEEWTRKSYRERIGKRAGWSAQQVELAFDTFSQWQHNPLPI